MICRSLTLFFVLGSSILFADGSVNGFTFEPETPSIARHPSGDMILWYKEKGKTQSNIEILPYINQQFDFTKRQTLATIHGTEGVCSLSVSTGGVIYVGFRGSFGPLSIAAYSDTGKLLWLDKVITSDKGMSGDFSQCAISSTINDWLLVESDQFILRHKHQEEITPPVLEENKHSLSASAMRPVISRTGGYSFLKTPASSDSTSFCLFEPYYRDKLFCKEAPTLTANSFHPPIILANSSCDPKEDCEYDARAVIAGERDVQIFKFGLDPTGGAGFERLKHFPYPGTINALRVAITANIQFDADPNDAHQDANIASILFLTQGTTNQANVIHQWTADRITISPPPLTLPDTLQLPEISHPAILVDDLVPCNISPGYQPIHQFFVTADGQAFNIQVNDKGGLQLGRQVAIPYLNNTMSSQTIAEISGSQLVVLAGSDTQWRLTSVPLGEFELIQRTPSIQFSRGSTDLSYGLEVRLDGLPDYNEVTHWALAHVNGDGVITSFFNDQPSNNQHDCGRTLDQKNQNDPKAIGITLSKGSTSFGSDTIKESDCMEDHFGNFDPIQNFYLMKYLDGLWQFTGKRLQLTENYDTRGARGALYWRPYQPHDAGSGQESQPGCDVTDYALSAPRVGYWLGEPGFQSFGYSRIVLNAADFEQAKDPDIPSDSPNSYPNKAEQAGISVVTASASIIWLVVMGGILYKYVHAHSKKKQYEKI